MSTGIRIGVILSGRYRVCNKIGEGGFGTIFKAVDISNHGKEVAVKISTKQGAHQLEKVDSTKPKMKEVVKPSEPVCDFIYEYYALKHLENYPGFPRVYAQGIYRGQSYMVMELLGRSLGKIFKEGNSNMSLTNLLLLLDQCLTRIKHIHEMGMVHGDIKPDNMMMGIGENAGTLYFIDFGLVSCFWDDEAGKHLELRERVHQGGTVHFMSVEVHALRQKGRRDDLETLAYVLAYFLKHKKLPWREYVDYAGSAVAEKKRETKEEVLFYGYPKEFAVFFNEVRNLKFEDHPEYEGYKRMFRRLGTLLGINYETDLPRFRNFD